MYDFYEMAKGQFELMQKTRRILHQYPEIDRELDNTANLVVDILNQHEIKHERFSNNGIIAVLGNANKSNQIIALRADMDALEVIDEKSVEYKSKKFGYMHACGHDAHTAILLGTAVILKSIEANLNGSVKLIFQPAEETDGGAKEMIEHGALNNVSAIFGLHVDENLDTGVIGINSGVVYAASNPFKVIVNGKGAHGASPHAGIDSIFIAAKIIDNLQAIISREISPTESAVISIGKINGGTALNAICGKVTMEGILRTIGEDLRQFSKERMSMVTKTTAEAYRGIADIEFIEGYPSFKNDITLVKNFKLINETSNIEIVDLVKPSLGVEDFAYYAQRIPALFYKIGIRNNELGINHPAHGGYFDIDEDSMIFGAMLQSKVAYEFLLNHCFSNF